MVYVIGQFNPGVISSFKRTQTFSEEDFRILESFAGNFQSLIVTPHILTEVTDLLESFNQKHKNQIFPILRKLLTVADERYNSSLSVAESDNKRFDKFGLADSMTIEIASQKITVLTDDLELYGYLVNLGLPTVNFNHLRGGYLLR